MAAASSCWTIDKARDIANSRRDSKLQNDFNAPMLKNVILPILYHKCALQIKY